jgi:hypothetical protein
MRPRLFMSLLILLIVPSAIAETRECTSDRDCKKGYVCRGDEHSTRCEELVCSAEVLQVCGLDGRTYSNACIAALQGVGVAYQGVCGRCGGLAGRQCAPWEFCDLDPGVCKMSNGEGTCRPAPSACAQEQHLVCGCDGRNYANDCIRMMSRVPLAHDGPCLPAPKASATRPVTQQKPTRKPPHRHTASAASPPPSLPRAATEGCPQPVIEIRPSPPVPAPQTPSASGQQPQQSPVLETREFQEPHNHQMPTGSEESAEHGTSRGPQETRPQETPQAQIQETCKANTDCPRGQYCFWETGKCGSNNDIGVCRARAQAEDCLKIKNSHQVCGCDGNTYSDECWASAVGQSLKSPGACTDGAKH